MLFVFQYTKDMDPKWSYPISASLLLILGILTPLMVKEPQDVEQEKITFKKFKKLVKNSFYLVFTKWHLFIGFLNLMIINQDNIIG